MKAKKIGFLQETSYHENHIKLLQGALDGAEAEGFNLIRFTIENRYDHSYYKHQLTFLAGMIHDFDLDGLMFLGWTRDLNQPGFLLKLLSCASNAAGKNIPLLSIGKIFHHIPSVHVPGSVHIRELSEHLTGFHGYKKIVFIKPVFPDDRFSAYREVMRAKGLFDNTLVIDGGALGDCNDFNFSKRGDKIISILQERNLLDADAIMSMVNEEAVFLIARLKEMGFTVPGDIAVTGWEDSSIGIYHEPSVTSVYLPFYELAFQGCKKMSRLLNNEPTELCTPVLGNLRIRESCGCQVNSAIAASRPDQAELLSAVKEGLEKEGLSNKYTWIGLHIISATRLSDLYAVLAEKLEKTTIKSCYIFLLADGGYDQVLDFCYTTDEGQASFGQGTKVGNRMLSDGFLFDRVPHNYMLYILHFHNRLLGYVLFEPGPRDERFYHALSVQLSSSITGALTLSSLESTNVKLKEQTEQIQELNEQLKDENLRILTEMELAKRIQVGLLPSTIEHTNYDISALMIPAAEVGGDYYDVIRINGIDWIIMGDVSGHGVSAGLVMMMVQTSIHVVLSQQPDLKPDQLLMIINKTITHNIRKLKEEKFVTIIVLACYEGSRFYYAGMHLPMMIYRRQKAEIELIYTEGMWLGVIEDIETLNHNRYFDLEQGDCLLLYTDGLIEARHKDDRTIFYGVETLKEKLLCEGEKKASHIVEGIIKSLVDYKTNDDISLLVLKKT